MSYKIYVFPMCQMKYTACSLNAYKASGRAFPLWMLKANL